MRGSPLGDYRCTCIQLGLCSIAILDTDGLDVGLSPELGFEPGGLLDVMQVWVPVGEHVKEKVMGSNSARMFSTRLIQVLICF